MASTDPRIIEVNDTVFTARFVNGDELEMPNISSYVETEVQTPSTQKPVFLGTGVIVGRSQPGTISFNFEALPHVNVYSRIAKAHRKGESVSFKFRTKQKTILTPKNSAKLSIKKADGVFTLTGGGSPDLDDASFSIGDAIRDEDKNVYIVVDITGSGGGVVSNKPSADISNKGYTWIVPSIGRNYFETQITAFGGVSMTVNDSVTQTLEAQLRGLAPTIGVMVDDGDTLA